MNCLHCHTELAGPFCHACGQRAAAQDALSARAIAVELWAHLPVLDFKSVRSLRALFVPGKLTTEFIAGHRPPYLSPLKVYLLCAAVFFLATPYTGLRPGTLRRGSSWVDLHRVPLGEQSLSPDWNANWNANSA